MLIHLFIGILSLFNSKLDQIWLVVGECQVRVNIKVAPNGKELNAIQIQIKYTQLPLFLWSGFRIHPTLYLFSLWNGSSIYLICNVPSVGGSLPSTRRDQQDQQTPPVFSNDNRGRNTSTFFAGYGKVYKMYLFCFVFRYICNKINRRRLCFPSAT